MTTATQTKHEVIEAFIKESLPTYQQLAIDIHEHPEVSNYEVYSSQVLIDQLKKEGFEVTKDVAGHHTGFDARYK